MMTTTDDVTVFPRHAYVVEVYDCAGVLFSARAQDFARALIIAIDKSRQYPGLVVQMYNAEFVDIDSDGLTDDEREQISDAIHNAREGKK